MVVKNIVDNPPNFTLSIGDKEAQQNVAQNVRDLITQVEYESSDGMADLLKLTVMDPPNEQGKYPLRESKLFAPGNELGIRFGYGAQLSFVGRAIIRRVRPIYPGEGVPFIEVVAYTKDAIMADSKPQPLKERKKRGKKGKTVIKDSNASSRFIDMTFADAVEGKAEAYGMIADVDPTSDAPHDFIQKAGMSDYDFVRGLSNLTGYYFWVDGDEDGNWTLHFKNPETMDQGQVQEKEYTFQYNQGDFSSILNFEPELAIQESIVKFKVTSKDPDTGRLLECTIEEAGDESPDVKVSLGGKGLSSGLAAQGTLTPAGQELDKDYSSASDVKLFVGDFSFDIRANRVFRDENDLARWAVAWFRRQRENFLLGRLSVIGVENLMARQVHKLNGLGVGFNGRYFFTRVRHVFGDNAYSCDCSVRKIILQKPAEEELAEAFVLGTEESSE